MADAAASRRMSPRPRLIIGCSRLTPPRNASLNHARHRRPRQWTCGAARCEPEASRRARRPADPARSLAGRKHGGTVDSTALRAVQQPLKDAYRDDPQAAVITLEAHGELGEENISC